LSIENREPTPDRQSDRIAPRRPLRGRFERLRGPRQRSRLLGLPEIVALSAAAVLLLTAAASYFLLLAPARVRLRERQEERRRLEAQLRNSTEGVRRDENTQVTVDEILSSLEVFEARHLASSRSEGSTALIEELNRLIRNNNLRITTGVSFAQFDEVVPGTSARPRAATAGNTTALQNIFPGIGISLTVEGGYASMRRFIRDVEAGRQFIVINTVELEGVTDANSLRAADGPENRPVAARSLVSLRLDLAAFYRRASAAAVPEPEARGSANPATR